MASHKHPAQQAEEKLRGVKLFWWRANAFRLIVDSIPGLVLTRRRRRTRIRQSAMSDYFGLTLDKLKGWTTSDIVHRDDLPRVLPRGDTRSNRRSI